MWVSGDKVSRGELEVVQGCCKSHPSNSHPGPSWRLLWARLTQVLALVFTRSNASFSREKRDTEEKEEIGRGGSRQVSLLPQGGEQGLNQGLPEHPSREPHWTSRDLSRELLNPSQSVSLSESSNLLPVMQKRQQPVMEGAEEEGSRQATGSTLRAGPTLRREGRGSAPSLAHRCLPRPWPRR